MAAGPIIVATFIAVLVAIWVPRTPNVAADTRLLYPGANTMLGCLVSAEWKCGRSPDQLASSPYVGTSAVGPYAFLQYPLMVLLIYLGLSAEQVFTALALISLLAFLGMLFVLVYVPHRMGYTMFAPVLALTLLTSPFFYYGNSTFGETLAACLLVLLAATAARMSHPAVLAGAAWLAGVTKETAPLFVLALGVLAVVGSGPSLRSARFRLAGLALGSLAAVVTNALFNVFRYGALTNEVELGYLRGHGDIPALSFDQRLINFAGLLISPNGGVLLFWSSACALLIAGFVCGLRASFRHSNRRDWIAVGVGATFLALTVGLANWYQPFGWFAWGPRLILPWIPALTLVLVIASPSSLADLVRRLTCSRPRILATGFAFAVPALPHVGLLWAPAAAEELFQPDSSCPGPRYAKGERFFDCLNHWAWTKHPVLLDALHGFQNTSALLFGALFIACCVSLVALAGKFSRVSVASADD